MRDVLISLPSPDAVQKFADILAGLDGDFELVDGEYTLDARSLMGIFSFNLKKPIKFRIHNDTRENCEQLQRFFVT